VGKGHLVAFGEGKERRGIAIAVSAKTGKITIASTEKKRLEYYYAMATKETDITDGLDEQSLAALIERRLLGKNEHLANKEENKKKKTKNKKKKKAKTKEEIQKEREEKRKNREERKKNKKKENKKEEEKEDVSKGF